MDIKTKGFSMPDGNTHIFIPPAPTETDRGGITAKTRTTEGAEVVVDSDTGKGYIGTDHTLKEKGQAADSEAVGIAISEKADRIISSASGENVILTDSAEAPLQGLRVFGKSEQVTTKGYQLFDASKLPSKSQGGATVTNNGDGSFAISGSGNITSELNIEYKYTNAENVKRVLKPGPIKIYNHTTGFPRFIFQIYEKNIPVPTLNMDCGTAPQGLISKNITQQMLDNFDKIRIGIVGESGREITPKTIKPMVYQDGDGTWEPFTGGKPSPTPDNPSPIKSVGDKGNIELEVTGKNLFDYESVKKNGLDCERGTLEFINNGILIKAIGKDAYNAYEVGHKTIIINVRENDELELTWNANNKNEGFVYIFPNGKVAGMKSIQQVVKQLKYTVPKGISFITIRFGVLKAGESILYTDIMLRKTNTKSDITYEPYRALQSLTLSTPNGLPGIKVDSGGNYTDSNGQQWICDEIDLERGKYVQRIDKFIYDGSIDENWTLQSINLHGIANFNILCPNIIKKEHEYICNMFERQKTSIADTTNEGVLLSEFHSFYIRIKQTRASTVAELRTWLSSNPVEVFFAIETPIEHDLTPEEIAAYKALHTNKPTTVISNDESAHMEVTYAADTKTYVDKKIAEISTAIMQKGI